MTTDPLLTAFAEQLGLSVDEARPALERVIAALRTTLESGASVTLEGVGTFARSGAEHTFEPDASLVAALNGDYAGLSPVSEPVPVPFLTSFPVIPAASLEEPTITPVDAVDEGPSEPVLHAATEFEPAAEASIHPLDAGAADDVTIELGPNDNVTSPGHEEERDGDLAAVMAGVWTPLPSPPVAALETPNEDYESEVTVVEPGDDQGTLLFEEAGFSFVAETPARAEDALAPPPVFAPVVAAPFAATASAPPTPVPAAFAGDLETSDDGGWSKLWLVLPLVALVALGLWLWPRRDGADETTGAPLASQPATSATGSGEPIAAGGAPADPTVDSLLVTETEAAAAADNVTPSEPVAEPVPAQTGTAPATPAAPDGAGAYRPAPIPAQQPAPAREPARTRADPAPATRDPAARPELTREPVTTRPEAAPAPAPDTAPAGANGVRGTAPVDPSAGGFTWILASTDAADARERVAIYRSLGFRAAVLTAFVGGRQVHRVAVGQFAGAAQARAARSLLPNDAPADAWLLRLGRTP